MRLIVKHPLVEELRPSAEGLVALKAYLDREVEDALSGRKAQEQVWRDALRRYEGVPRNPVRNFPIENYPNIEVTLGAIATDAIYAQAIDLIFTASPPVTCRAVPGGDAKLRAKQSSICQEFVNWGVANEWGLREACENTILDDVQLGTGVFFVPWVEDRRKTKAHKIVWAGPHVFTWPIEDFIIPGGARGDLQLAKWCGFREWLTKGDLEERAIANKWDVSDVTPVGALGWVRSRRELLGNTYRSSSDLHELYEIYQLGVYFDIDGDGLEEDLWVAWDRTARSILFVGYNPYDIRPAEAARYQRRAHLFYGMGVMDMIAPFQDELTEVHNHRIANMMLVNARFWKAKDGSVPDNMVVYAGKVQFMQNPDDLQEVQMADVYPSSAQAEGMVISLAERRVGVNDVSQPRPSGIMGTRTPGITALSMLQQVNKRFTPAFLQIREAIAGAIRQCLYRYSERLLMQDAQAEAHINAVLGEEKGKILVGLLRDTDFAQSVAVEMTAATASINREADRQNAMLLVNILAQYYQRTLELVMIASNPQTPEPVRDVAKKIAESAGAIIERTIRTFDQVRDPQTFIIQIENELDGMEGLPQEGLQGLGNFFSQLEAGEMPALPGLPAPPPANGSRRR